MDIETKMSDQHVPRGATAKLDRVEGELKVGRHARIEASSGNMVSVSGSAVFEGNAEVDCDFECDSLRVSSGGALQIRGNLTVRKMLDVNHSIEVSGTIAAGEIDVGGRIEARSLTCTRMRVGGRIEVTERLEVESLNVGGKVEAPGTVVIRDFDVGGQAEIGGGKISGKIRVGGKFESKDRLEFGDLGVLGHMRLAGGSKGAHIFTNGQLLVSGDFECDEVEINGKTEINGSCRLKKVKVNGILGIRGSLEGVELLEINGSAEIDRDLGGTDIHVGGKLEARKVVATNEIEIAGVVRTDIGLKGKTVRIASGSRIEGPIVAEKVDVGKSYGVIMDWEKKWMGQVAAMRLVGRMTKVEDIYAEEVHLGKASKSGKIFTKVVEIEDGCVIDEIYYSEELKGRVERSHIERTPIKVETLSEPPL